MVTIEANESRYRFKETKELYRKNGNVITKEMYEPSRAEMWMIGCMVLFLILMVVLDGGFSYWSIRAIIIITSYIYPWISYAVLSSNNSMVTSPFAKRNEEICKAIVEMSDEEIELRESRKKRDMAGLAVPTVLFLYVVFFYKTEPHRLWTEDLQLMLGTLALSCIIGLPLIYYRHRATKRIKMFLLMKAANNQNTTDTMPRESIDREIRKKVVNSTANKFCPNCGNLINVDGAFCPSCGNRIENFCMNCGASLEKEVRYCPNCGKKNQ